MSLHHLQTLTPNPAKVSLGSLRARCDFFLLGRSHVRRYTVALGEGEDAELIRAVKVLIEGYLRDAHRNVWRRLEDLE